MKAGAFECDRHQSQGHLQAKITMRKIKCRAGQVQKRLRSRKLNMLPEFGGNKALTPLSDHLHDLFGRWIKDEIFLPNEFTPAFEEFELLGGLTSLSIGAAEKQLDAMISDKSGQHWLFAPVGRIAWDGSTARQIFDKWKTSEGRKPLLDAGFPNGDAVFLKRRSLV